MILIPSEHGTAENHMHDPYTEAGARSVARRFRSDVLEMFDYMLEVRREYSLSDGKAMLSESPLKSKIWVAAAMKTLGWVEEHETRNGACALTLTERALTQLENIRRFDQAGRR